MVTLAGSVTDLFTRGSIVVMNGNANTITTSTSANTTTTTTMTAETVTPPVKNFSSIYDEPRPTNNWDDATWILTSSFIIFTMQSGFGMLESGCVSHKNEVNIMMKNVGDVIFGGISYWMLGYGFSFGTDPGTNPFCGIGKFFLDPGDVSTMGQEYSRFVFQASFATTATTIVSGAVAERAQFTTYLVFSFFNTFIYCFPAHWVWAQTGWLKQLGVVDVAGDGPVHVVGGVSALVATILIKPRKGRFTSEDYHEMESPVGAILGLFILWWSWLAFNCGSTFGISGGKWKVASRAATNTLMAANSGGIVSFVVSYLAHRKFYVSYVINGVLASLVSITACCAVTSVKESLIVGGTGALLCLVVDAVMKKVKLDDPVSAFAVHGVGGMWGLIATGLFAHKDTVALIFNDHDGLVAGGGFYLLGVQCLALVSIGGWTLITAYILLKGLDLLIGLRLTDEEEELGADFVEHNVNHRRLHKTRRKSMFAAPLPRSSLTPLTPPPPFSTTTTSNFHVNPAFSMEDETGDDNQHHHSHHHSNNDNHTSCHNAITTRMPGHNHHHHQQHHNNSITTRPRLSSIVTATAGTFTTSTTASNILKGHHLPILSGLQNGHCVPSNSMALTNGRSKSFVAARSRTGLDFVGGGNVKESTTKAPGGGGAALEARGDADSLNRLSHRRRFSEGFLRGRHSHSISEFVPLDVVDLRRLGDSFLSSSLGNNTSSSTTIATSATGVNLQMGSIDGCHSSKSDLEVKEEEEGVVMGEVDGIQKGIQEVTVEDARQQHFQCMDDSHDDFILEGDNVCTAL